MRHLIFLILFFATAAFSKTEFSDPEANFQTVMKRVMDRHLDKTITKADLYKAATAGLLHSLNQEGEDWNELLTPEDMKEMEIELSGKVVGIGAEMKFDETTGFARILRVIPQSPAEKSGLKLDDQILSVEGQKYKGRKFAEMVEHIRGEAGKSVKIKILREDQILNLNIKREVIPWTPVDMQALNESTALLTVGYFTEATPKAVAEFLTKLTEQNFKKLILDLRGNSGGSFTHAVETAGLFLEKGALIVSTRDRTGRVEEFRNPKAGLSSTISIVILTNKSTSSGAELMTAALKENRKVKTVGEATFGKWNAQTLEKLPNQFAMKFTINEFRAPSGKTYKGEGLRPDLEVSLASGLDVRSLRAISKTEKRLLADSQLKAATEILE